MIGHLRTQHTRWIKADREAQDKDQVLIDFRGTIDGIAFSGGEAHDYPIVLGSHTMIPGFEEGIVGMKTGEEKSIPVTFPENYPAKEVARKAAQFGIKVIRISQPELPALQEEFIKKLGVKTGKLEDLYAEVKKNLERELERVVRLKLKNQVFDVLLKQNPLEIPGALIEREASRIHDEVHPHHGQSHSHTKEEMVQFNEPAKRNVALGLLVAELIKQHKLSINAERIQAYLNKMATAYEDPAAVMKWYANNKRAQAEVEMQILEEQLVEKLLENVQVTEKNISYHELINS